MTDHKIVRIKPPGDLLAGKTARFPTRRRRHTAVKLCRTIRPKLAPTSNDPLALFRSRADCRSKQSQRWPEPIGLIDRSFPSRSGGILFWSRRRVPFLRQQRQSDRVYRRSSAALPPNSPRSFPSARAGKCAHGGGNSGGSGGSEVSNGNPAKAGRRGRVGIPRLGALAAGGTTVKPGKAVRLPKKPSPSTRMPRPRTTIWRRFPWELRGFVAGRERWSSAQHLQSTLESRVADQPRHDSRDAG